MRTDLPRDFREPQPQAPAEPCNAAVLSPQTHHLPSQRPCSSATTWKFPESEKVLPCGGWSWQWYFLRLFKAFVDILVGRLDAVLKCNWPATIAYLLSHIFPTLKNLLIYSSKSRGISCSTLGNPMHLVSSETQIHPSQLNLHPCFPPNSFSKSA